MRAKFKFLIVIVLIAISGCSFSPQIASDKDYVLKDLQGNNYDLLNLKGHYTLLHFWSTWCNVCKSELISIQNFEKAVKDSDLRVITIAIDSAIADIKETKETYNLKLKIINDDKDTAKDFYKIRDVPMTILLDREGKITKFKEPESSNPVLRTKGAQKWDRRDVIEYFLKFVK